MSSACCHPFWTFWIISLLVYASTKMATARFSSYVSEFEYSPRFHPSRNPACSRRFVRGDRPYDDEFIAKDLAPIEVAATMLRCSKRKFKDDNEDVGSEMKSRGQGQNCTLRIVIQVKFNNVGKMKNEEEFLVVDRVHDPTTMKSFRLRNPYVIKVRQEPVLHLYGLKFQSVVNAEAREEVINNRNSNYTGCDDGTESPTCGQLFTGGEPIPFSQGFCCSCDRRVNEERQHGNGKKLPGSSSVGAKPNCRDVANCNRSEAESIRTNLFDSRKTFGDIHPAICEPPTSSTSSVPSKPANCSVVNSNNGRAESTESMGTHVDREKGRKDAASTLLSKKESTETSSFSIPKSIFKSQYFLRDEGRSSTVTSFLARSSPVEVPTSNAKTNGHIRDDNPARSFQQSHDFSWQSNRAGNYEKTEVQNQLELTTKSLRDDRSFVKASDQKGGRRFHSRETKRKSRKFPEEKSSNHREGPFRFVGSRPPSYLRQSVATCSRVDENEEFPDGFHGKKVAESDSMKSRIFASRNRAFSDTATMDSCDHPTVHFNGTLNNTLQAEARTSSTRKMTNNDSRENLFRKNLPYDPRSSSFFRNSLHTFDSLKKYHSQQNVVTKSIQPLLTKGSSKTSEDREEVIENYTPQKRTLKELASKGNSNFRKLTRREMNKEEGKHFRPLDSVHFEDNFKSSRIRRFNKSLKRRNKKSARHRRRDEWPKNNGDYGEKCGPRGKNSKHDVQVFIDYPRLQATDLSQKSRAPKLHGDEKTTLATENTNVKPLLENEDLFSRREDDRQKNVDEQIEEKFARISDALKEDVLEGTACKESGTASVTTDEINSVKTTFSRETGKSENTETKFAQEDEVSRVTGHETIGPIRRVEPSEMDEKIRNSNPAIREGNEAAINKTFYSEAPPIVASGFNKKSFHDTSASDAATECQNFRETFRPAPKPSDFRSESTTSKSGIILNLQNLHDPTSEEAREIQLIDSDDERSISKNKETTEEPISEVTKALIVVDLFRVLTSPLTERSVDVEPTDLPKQAAYAPVKLDEEGLVGTTETSLSFVKNTEEISREYFGYASARPVFLAFDEITEVAVEKITSDETSRITDATFRPLIEGLGDVVKQASTVLHNEVSLDDTTFLDETDAPKIETLATMDSRESGKSEASFAKESRGDTFPAGVRGESYDKVSLPIFEDSDEKLAGRRFGEVQNSTSRCDESSSENVGIDGMSREGTDDLRGGISNRRIWKATSQISKLNEETPGFVSIPEKSKIERVLTSRANNEISVFSKPEHPSVRKTWKIDERENYGKGGNSMIRTKPAMKFLVEAENIQRNFLKFSVDNRNDFGKKSISFSKDPQLRDKNSLQERPGISNHNRGLHTTNLQIGQFNEDSKEEHPWFFTTEAPEFIATLRNNIDNVFIGKTTASISQHSAPDENGIDNGKIITPTLQTNERKRRLLSIPKPMRTKDSRDRRSSNKNNIHPRSNPLRINTNTDASNKRDFHRVRKHEKRSRMKNHRKSKKRIPSHSPKATAKRQKNKRSKKHLYDYSDNRYSPFPNFHDRSKENFFQQRDYQIDDKNPAELFRSYEPIPGSMENFDRPLNAGPNLPGASKEFSSENQLYRINDFENLPDVFDAADQSGPTGMQEDNSESLLSAIRSVDENGKDLKISLTGKIHVDGGLNGREFSLSFDGAPELSRKDSTVDEKLDRHADSSPSANSVIDAPDEPLSSNTNFSPDDFPLRSTMDVLPGGLEQAKQANDGLYAGNDGFGRYEDQPTGDRIFGSPRNSEKFREKLAYKNALLRHRLLKKNSGKFDKFDRHFRGFDKYPKSVGNVEDGGEIVPEKSEAEDVEEEPGVDDESSNVEQRNRFSISSNEPVIKEGPPLVKSSEDLVHFPDIFENFLSNEKLEERRANSPVKKFPKEVAKVSDANSCYKMNTTLKKLDPLEATTMQTEKLAIHKNIPSANYHANSFHGHANKIQISTDTHSPEYPANYTTVRGKSVQRVEAATASIERKNAMAIVEFVKKLEGLARSIDDPRNQSGNPVIHLKKFIIVPEIRSSPSGKKYESAVTTTERVIIMEEGGRRGKSREEKPSKIKEIFVDQRSDTFQDYADGSADPTIKTVPAKQLIPSRVNSDVIPLYSLTEKNVKGKSRCLVEGLDGKPFSDLASISREASPKGPAGLSSLKNRRETSKSSLSDTTLLAYGNQKDKSFLRDNSQGSHVQHNFRGKLSNFQKNCQLKNATGDDVKSSPHSNPSLRDLTQDFRHSVDIIEPERQGLRREGRRTSQVSAMEKGNFEKSKRAPNWRSKGMRVLDSASDEIVGQQVATGLELRKNSVEVAEAELKSAGGVESPSRLPRRQIDGRLREGSRENTQEDRDEVLPGIKTSGRRPDSLEKRAVGDQKSRDESASASLNDGRSALRRETSKNQSGIKPAKQTSGKKRRRKRRRKRKRKKKKKVSKNKSNKRNLLSTFKNEEIIPRSFADKSRGRREAAGGADLSANSRNEPQFSRTQVQIRRKRHTGDLINSEAAHPPKRKLLAIAERRTLKKQRNAESYNEKYTKKKKNVESENVQIRGGQDCPDRGSPASADPSRIRESAHCLRFSDLWYSVYRLDEPVIDHRVHLQIYEKRGLRDGTTLWRDLTRGSTVRLGSLDRQYENPEGTIAFEYNEITLRARRDCNLDPVRDRLLVPFSISRETLKHSEHEGYSREYLVVQEDAIREDGKECDKAGVGFAAFHGQQDRCGRVRGACLKNQPLAYWRHDTEARADGRAGCYFLSNFAAVPSEAVRYDANGSGSREFLALEYQSPHVSALDVLLRLEDNALQRTLSSGRITEVYVDNMSVDRTVMTITIANRGPNSSPFRPRIVGCPSGLPCSWSRVEGPARIVTPHRERKVALELDGRLPVDEFSCVVELINRHGDIVATRGIRVRKMDRCYCAWRRACSCEGEDFGKKFISTGVFVLILITTATLLALLILGFSKWLVGIFSPAVSRWGLDAILGPTKMEEYFEKDLKSKDLVVDHFGAPVHPDTGKRTVRICKRRVEFLLNVLFFYAYPFAICCAKPERSTAAFYSNESKTTLISERDDHPRMVTIGTYGDSANSALELEDTRYVIDELKKSEESLSNRHNRKLSSHK